MDLNGPFVDDDDAADRPPDPAAPRAATPVLDLTPRRAPAVGGGDAARGRRLVVIGVLALLAVVVVGIVYQGLSNATLYFRNADEAVEQRDELGARRFRLQGAVVEDSVDDGGDQVRFAVAHGGATVQVRHVGDPPELFRPGIPVVLEGAWDESGDFFDSDRILVKHDEDYEADNPDRVEDYQP